MPSTVPGSTVPAVLHQNLRQHPGYRRSDFVGHIISINWVTLSGINLDQRFVHGNRITRPLEPSPDRQLVASAWHSWDLYFCHRTDPKILVHNQRRLSGLPLDNLLHITGLHPVTRKLRDV